MPRNDNAHWEERGSKGASTARHPDRFVKEHAAPLLFNRTREGKGRHSEIASEQVFWEKCPKLALKSVSLDGFRLTDWFPRAPGVFWSPYGIDHRRYADSRRVQTDPELGPIYKPDMKMSLIESGGIGTIRLRPRRIDNTDCWLATALTGPQCAGGIPLAFPDALLQNGRVDWGDTVSLRGQVRFLHDAGLEATGAAVHHAPPVLVFVEEVKRLPKSKQSNVPIVITPVVLFNDGESSSPIKVDRGWDGEFGYTFVQCAAGSDHELDGAAVWVEKYATKHGGRIITNFDEQRPILADAPLSYQRLVKKTYDRTIIEHLHFNGTKLADRIDRVEEVMSVNVTLGDGTVIHGDFVVANSIKESFNRVKDSSTDPKLKAALQQLSSQVGALVAKLDPDNAQKAADALDTLTKEAARPKPRREWWELSLKGIKEAATAVRDIGKPVIETVAMVAPLLAAASS